MRQRHRCPRTQCPLAPAAPAHHEPLFAVQPIELLVIHRVTFARQQPAQAPIAEAPPLRGQFAQPLPQCRVVRSSAPIAQSRMIQSHQPARAPLTQPVTAPSPASLLLAAPQASDVFSEQVLERRVIQHRLGQQLLQPPVLILQRLQPARLRDLQPAVLRFPLNGMDGSHSPIAKMANNAIEREVSQ